MNHRERNSRRKTQPPDLAAILAHTPGILFLIDVEPGEVFRYRAVSQAFLTRYGLTENDIVGQVVADRTQPPSPTLVISRCLEACRTKSTVTWEHCWTDDSGARCVEAAVTPILDKRGSCKHLLSVANDVTTRKRAEAALRDSEERFRRLFEDALVGIYRTTPDGRILMANPALIRMVGYESFAELKNRNLEAEGFAPEHPRSHFKELLDQQGFISGLESRWIRADGSDVFVRENARAQRDDDGRILYYEGTVEDITALKRAEEALRRNESRLQRTLDFAPVGLSMVAVDRHLTWCNKAFCDFLGYAAAELIGKTIVEITYPEDAQFGMASLEALLAGDAESSRVQKRYLRKDGGIVWGDVVTSLIRDERGTPLYFLPAVADITQLKWTEHKLRELNATLEQRIRARTAELERGATQLRALVAELALTEERERQRLAGVLHDGLQQLLVAAKLGSVALREQVAADEHKAQAARVIDLLGQSIDASRSLTLELCPPILSDAGLAPALTWLAKWMREKHGLAVAVTAPEPAVAVPDDVSHMLFQAVRELLFNVVKHAGVKNARVTMTLDGGRNLTVAVADDGQGFDAAAHAAGNAAGSFGLFSIRERFALLDGRMEIDSAPGRGTCVTLTAPLTPADRASPAEATPQSDTELLSPATVPSPIRIVVADDHTLVRKGLVELLHKTPGLVVVGEAAEGWEALERARQLKPDVVLMDVAMPRMNGIDATRLLCGEMPAVRVVGLSMHASADTAARMHEAGAVGYLAKDSAIDDLIAALRHAATRP
jgi:PAS domain S-box-containing protein